VSLNSGAIRYISKHGQMFNHADLNTPVATDIALEEAILASAAIPAVFAPGLIADEIYVDGGVREVVPIEACGKLGATTIVGISCNDPLLYMSLDDLDARKNVLTSIDQIKSRNVNISKFALRSIDIAVEEVLQGDIRIGQQASRTVYIVKPEMTVHDTL